MRRAAPELLERGTVSLMAGNALDEALLDQHGPFDAIHVGAAADDLPQVSFVPCPFQGWRGMTISGPQVNESSFWVAGLVLLLVRGATFIVKMRLKIKARKPLYWRWVLFG